jgi:hypothetical protein
VRVSGELGSDFEGAFAEMVRTVEELPGTFKAEFSLTYWAGVTAPAEAWCCSVEGDIHGDDGSHFVVLGKTAAEVLRLASAEAWRRVPGSA